jgi:hypothetical protein
MSDFTWSVRDYLRRFLDEGRLTTLIWFLLASFAIAGIEWALSPQIARLWFPPISFSDRAYFTVLSVFAFLWLAVAIAGLVKCGWAGLLILIPIKWGLLPVYMIVMLVWSCTHGNCI